MRFYIWTFFAQFDFSQNLQLHVFSPGLQHQLRWLRTAPALGAFPAGCGICPGSEILFQREQLSDLSLMLPLTVFSIALVEVAMKGETCPGASARPLKCVGELGLPPQKDFAWFLELASFGQKRQCYVMDYYWYYSRTKLYTLLTNLGMSREPILATESLPEFWKQYLFFITFQNQSAYIWI